MPYVGRFAPSPTGPLHLGSLLTAAASFLHARQAGGRWLLRIEDIDPPRAVEGAADTILHTLEALKLHWDGDVLYQSEHVEVYEGVAASLRERGSAFRCSCSRSALVGEPDPAGLGPRYPGTCRSRKVHEGSTSLRLETESGNIEFVDGLQGPVSLDVAATVGDFVIFRKDGWPAYHLAVVIDDAHQGVDTVVRGSDLLQTTCIHLSLMQALELPAPRYFHIPVLVDAAGRKISKRHGAPSVDPNNAGEVVSRVLALLGIEPPPAIRGDDPQIQWEWAIENWSIEHLSGRSNIAAPDA